MSGTNVAVLGTWQSKFRTRDTEHNFAEQAQLAALGAMEACGMTPDDIDAIVFSMAPTFFMGVADADKWATDYLFAANKPVMRVHTGGATGGSAAQTAYTLVKSGLHRSVLVVGADRIAESPDAQAILNLIFDPFYERQFPLAITTASAMQARRYMQEHGVTQADFAQVVVRQRRNAAKNPHAHLQKQITIDEVLESPMIAYPIKVADCSPRSGGSAAMIVGNDEMVSRFQTRPAFMNAVSSVTDTYWVGDRVVPSRDRDWNEFDLPELAAVEAYRQAGIRDPRSELQVAELYDGISNISYHMLENMGFCSRGTAARLDREGIWDADGGEVAVNPSGGVLCTNPISIAGLLRVIESANQVMGVAGEMQVRDVKNALAVTAGGIGQFANCTILGDEPRSAAGGTR